MASKQSTASITSLSLLSPGPLPQKAVPKLLLLPKKHWQYWQHQILYESNNTRQKYFCSEHRSCWRRATLVCGPVLSPPTKAAAARGAAQAMSPVVHHGAGSFLDTVACLFESHPMLICGAETGDCSHRWWTGENTGGSKSVVSFWKDPCGRAPCGAPCQSECRERCVPSFSQHFGDSPVEGLMRENWLCHLEQASRHRSKKLCNNLMHHKTCKMTIVHH